MRSEEDKRRVIESCHAGVEGKLVSYRSCSTSYSDTSTAANWECGLWCVQYSICVPYSTWGECGQDHVCPTRDAPASCAVLLCKKADTLS